MVGILEKLLLAHLASGKSIGEAIAFIFAAATLQPGGSATSPDLDIDGYKISLTVSK